jgi:hypothetical protein
MGEIGAQVWQIVLSFEAALERVQHGFIRGVAYESGRFTGIEGFASETARST